VGVGVVLWGGGGGGVGTPSHNIGLCIYPKAEKNVVTHSSHLRAFKSYTPSPKPQTLHHVPQIEFGV